MITKLSNFYKDVSKKREKKQKDAFTNRSRISAERNKNTKFEI